MVEESLKIYHTPEAFYLDHLRSLCARAEIPTSLVEGKSSDEHACYVRHDLSQKGNFYSIKSILCNSMLGIYVNYMILLVVLKTLRNTFPTNVSLVIMESYLRMLRVFKITMKFKKFKKLLLLRVLMKLLVWWKSMMLLFTNLKILPYLNIVMIIMLLTLQKKHFHDDTCLSQ